MFSSVKATLQQLLLNDNQLRQLSAEAFTDMPMLEVLDLRRNMINNISADSLRNLPRLQKLQLSGNYISSLGHVLLQSLPMLAELDLSENIISQFPDSLLASNVSQLDLSVNNLHQLPGELLCHMGSLQHLALEDNPVICDCSLRMLRKCLPSLQLSGTCAAPADVEGQNLEVLTECAPSMSVITAWSPWSPSLAVLNSPVGFPLEPTPSHTWSPLLETSSLTAASATLLAADPPAISLTAATPTSQNLDLMTPTASARASLLSSQLPETLLISPSSSAQLTPSISPTLHADIIMHISVHSLPNWLLSSSDKITPAWPSDSQSLVLKLSPGTATISVTSHVRPGLVVTPAGAGGHSQPSPAAAGLTDWHDPLGDIGLNYDVYLGHEIVRPLVAVKLSERDDPLPVTSGTDLSQSSVVDADFDWLSSSVVDTEPDSSSSVEAERTVSSGAPLPHDGQTEALPPGVGQVRAEPSLEDGNGLLSVAGEITVAMFFSLVILLSILSGILLYRKYFHVGSYNATSPATHPPHLIQMQGLGPNFTHSASDDHSACEQVPPCNSPEFLPVTIQDTQHPAARDVTRHN